MIKNILLLILGLVIFCGVQAFAKITSGVAVKNKTLSFEYPKSQTEEIDGFLLYCNGKVVTSVSKEDVVDSDQETNYYNVSYPETCVDSGVSSYSVKELLPDVSMVSISVALYDFSKFRLSEKTNEKGTHYIAVVKDEAIEMEIIPIEREQYVSTLTGLRFYLFNESEVSRISEESI